MKSSYLKNIGYTLLVFFSLAIPAFSEERIEVGALIPLSGNWAALGENLHQGLTLAAEEINGDVNPESKKVNLIFRDTDEEKSGGKVVSAYRALRSKGIKFFIGPCGVPGIMSLIPIAATDDVILIGPTATNSYYKQSNKFFNASGDNLVTTAAAARHAYQNGSRRVAIFGSLQPWETEQARIFKEEFIRLGGKIVTELYPQADQRDFSVEALKVKTANPDTIFFAIFNQIALAAKMLQQMGVNGTAKYAAFLDDIHITSSEGALNGTKVFLFSPPGQDFVKKYQDKFGKAPGIFADSAYDALISLVKAINSSTEKKTETIIQSMLSLEFPASSGKLTAYDHDGLISRDIGMLEVFDGKLKPG